MNNKIVGNTPLKNLQNFFGVKNLYMKDETTNPTHTFKDRLAFEMLRPTIKQISLKSKPKQITFGSISYGNTAYSMGYFCNKLNFEYGKKIVKAIAFIPPKIIQRSYGPDTENNIINGQKILKKLKNVCEVIDIDLSAKIYQLGDLKNLALKNKTIIGSFIDVTEGLNRPAYRNIISEIIEKQLKTNPDYLIVPFGAGILCNEMIDYVEDKHLKTKIIPVSTGNPNSIAIMLYGPIWLDTKSLLSTGQGLTKHKKVDLKGRNRNQYMVYHVGDEEIFQAMKLLKRKNISAEPSGAAGFAILHRLNKLDINFNSNKHTVVVINTGNGILNFI